jgi:TonB family protein
MKLSRVLLCLAALAAVALARGELRLVADSPDGPLVIDRITRARLSGRMGEGIQTVALDSAIRIEGDLLREARFIYWPTNYRLVHVPVRERSPAPTRPWFGYVRLVSGNGWAGQHLEQIWPDKVPEGAAVVFGWVVEGKMRHTRLALLPPRDRRDHFRVDQVFHLDEREASGHAVMLLWANGEFLPPRPRFRAEALQAAAASIMLDDVAGFQAALTRKLDVGARSHDGFDLLTLTALAGKVEALRLLMRAERKPYLERPLAWAVTKGRIAVVRELLVAKVKADGSVSGTTPLQDALFAGHDDVALALLEAGANPNRAGGSIPAPLTLAVDGGFASLARQMLARGARSFPTDPQLLHDQIRLGHTAMAQLMLEKKTKPNVEVGQRTALWLAVRTGNIALVHSLLQAGARVDQAIGDGTTPLMVACNVGHPEAIEALLQAGANVSLRNGHGSTATHFAAAHDSDAPLALLAARGADLDAPSPQGPRPLEIALLAGSAKAAHFLASRGARCDWSTARSDALLAAAVSVDLPDVVLAALRTGTTDEQRARAQAANRLVRLLGASACERELRASGQWEEGAAPPLVALHQLDAVPRTVKAPRPIDNADPGERFRHDVVEVELTIDETGAIAGARIRSSPDGRLNLPVLQAVRQWQLSPPQVQGKPARTKIVQAFSFDRTPDVPLDRSFTDAPPYPLTRWIPNLPFYRTGFDGSEAGDVRARCTIGPDGRVEETRIVNAKGEIMAWEAKKALPDWAFTPGVRDGKTVRARTEVLVPVDP